jgi:isoleucyl-tRNA synthetase
MPYAQWHITSLEDFNELKAKGRFPADYICEAVDQTRGWFYSLHALANLLGEPRAYNNVICLGLILDGRGRKMSKRLGNVVDPNAVLDSTSADALRWYLFTASHPGEPRRFSDKLVNETLRRVLLTLWNVYSFFTNYATIDQFHPDQVPQGWKPENELDRWILSELNVLVSHVDDYLEHYNPTDAGRRIQEFIDGLSNWYVRRSRRRFWKSENDSDKLSAYATLYRCLVTITKLMAPLAPFMAEEMYQNLVRSVDAGAPDSVHLASFPAPDQSLEDQQLMDATRLAMKISSMGRAARSKAGLKVRQPLNLMKVMTRNALEKSALDKLEDQFKEELNIKNVQITSPGGGEYDLSEENFWDWHVSANMSSIGPKFGQNSMRIKNALDSLDPQQARKVVINLKINGSTVLSIQDENVHLSREDIVTTKIEPSGHSVVEEGSYAVAVETTVTPELAQEGLARELAHRIQNLRKDAGFEITDRIVTYYQGPEEVGTVMRNHADYIKQETLSEKLVPGSPEDGAKVETQKVEGMEVTLGVRRV